MMDILDLKYLAAAANAGNFGRAAKALSLNTSTISRRIGRLEVELEFALFERCRGRRNGASVPYAQSNLRVKLQTWPTHGQLPALEPIDGNIVCQQVCRPSGRITELTILTIPLPHRLAIPAARSGLRSCPPRE